MDKVKKSGPAIFMDLVILITAGLSVIMFLVYYADIYKVKWVLWTGITSFTIMYHLWLRIIVGNITTKFKNKIKYTTYWFKEKGFEKKLYKLLRVKKWKNKVLTYEPELFDINNYSLEKIMLTMTKAELDHWLNEVISLSTLLFGVIWGEIWLFFLIAIAAMLFDAQFIVIQRYNRPRALKLLRRNDKKFDKN